MGLAVLDMRRLGSRETLENLERVKLELEESKQDWKDGTRGDTFMFLGATERRNCNGVLRTCCGGGHKQEAKFPLLNYFIDD
jgi:hypothetical protein